MHHLLFLIINRFSQTKQYTDLTNQNWSSCRATLFFQMMIVLLSDRPAVFYSYARIKESRYFIPSGIMIGSSVACCLVGSEIIFIKNLTREDLGFNKSSFRSPTIIIFFVFS